MEVEESNLIQTVILMLDRVSDSEIVFKYGLGKYLIKARKIYGIVIL